MAIRITGMNSGMDTDSIVQELMSAYRAKGEKYTKKQTTLSWKQDKWKSLNSKIYKFYTSLDKMRFTAGYAMKKTTVSDATKATITAGSNAVNGTQSLKIKELATSAYLTGAEIKNNGNAVSGSTRLADLDPSFAGKTATITIEKGNGDKLDISLTENSTIDEFIDKVNEAGIGVKASFDSTNNRIFISSQQSGEKAGFTLKKPGTGTDDEAALKALGLEVDKDDENAAQMVEGRDAEIILNNAKFTSSTNTFNINGLTIQALAKTGNEELSITTATDTQGLYDKIKDFISEYNSLITEMATLYNADSSKGYEPLTADEKEAMTEKEIEEWEKKIKDSVLRRDDTLSGLINTMTSAMLGTVKIGDKNYSLASLGIKSGGYFSSTAATRNQLHIDGDEEDDTVSGNADQLMAMLNSDPDKVIQIFQGITNNMSQELYKRMQPTTLRSVHTVYNDKEMAQSYSDYTKTIRKWEEKMQKIEDSYYKKFSAMEVALGKLQSQSSSFTSMLGM